MEDGEHWKDSGSGPRIVRVGTHALRDGSKTRLWTRFSQHRGQLRSGGGNHRGSIFRLIVGTALIERHGYDFPTWDDRTGAATAEVRAAERALEREVSVTIGAMRFGPWAVRQPKPRPFRSKLQFAVPRSGLFDYDRGRIRGSSGECPRIWEAAMVDLRLTAAATILALATMSGASAQEATELWALDGLSAPESALFDEARDVLYVSNVAGQPTERNGAGFISRVSPAGEIEELEWVTGLDAPKGLALDGATLYVTDIDRLVAIDVEAGEIVGTWAGEGAQFLNDPAVDGAGRVFVSDMATSAIYLLDDDDFTLWLQDEALQHPNGLKVADGRLIVAAWGQDMQPDFSTRVPGHLLAVDLASKAIAPLGSGAPVGNLDGLEPDGDGNWLATDWIAGALFRISPDGSYQQLLDLDQGSADIGYIARERVVIIPMMMNDRIVAYRLE